MIRSINHVNLVVEDLARAVSFYGDVLGLRETMRARLEGDWIEQVTGMAGVQAECVYMEAEEGARIELLRFDRPEAPAAASPAPPNAPGLRHLAFEVGDIDSAYARLRAAGVEFVGEPVEVPAISARHTRIRKRLVYFRDPEGNLLELAEFRER